MDSESDILKILKEAVLAVYQGLRSCDEATRRSAKYSAQWPKELKAQVDQLADQTIFEYLRPMNLPILSEEDGSVKSYDLNKRGLIVDPVDGTVNFVRGLGPAATSIALWDQGRPLLGVVLDLTSGELFWGGAGIGAFCNDKAITVSTIAKTEESVYCTGFPVRYEFSNRESLNRKFETYARFSKVRMFGSASISLTRVASGAAEVYEEEEIMLWDVAAGLALVEGAGGRMSIAPGKHPNAFHVTASNGKVGVLHASD